ncbi:hypothetical protein Leryth_012796 [Lithospermum erythrorhizon]|nr:hypothetical protein Leryth_012796 [Lithospermum erythrorhizon]
MSNNDVSGKFRGLVESAEKKFARVRDLPLYSTTRGQNSHNFHKVFSAYTKLWKFQQENRRELIELGLHRWEIGEIASRIGQLYYSQYMRSSEMRFLVGAYVFYEAILSRRYFEGSEGDRGVRYKELRFYARFLMVALLLNRVEMVDLLLERFRGLVDESTSCFPGTSFKEWKLVLQEVIQFNRSNSLYLNTRPLRYSLLLDSYPSSQSYVNRFHSKKVLKFRDAVLTSYHKNEVRFTEQTLDTFRMLQCLEWEPTGPIPQKHPLELRENGGPDHSITSGIIDMKLAADMTDPNLPPNPKKAILYRPAVTQLLAVIATICAELPPESVMLVYLSASGNHGGTTSYVEGSGNSKRSSKLSSNSHKTNNRDTALRGNNIQHKELSSQNYENHLWLGPCKNGGANFLYPDDLIPFTRRPLLLIIDSDNSHAFKVLHGAERGETAALLLSPLNPSHKNPGALDGTQNGSQFTFFLAAPLQAFCELVGLKSSNDDLEVFDDGDSIISAAFAQWEVTLCTSTSIDLAWAQFLSNPLLRRLILRFIFCRAVLTLFCLRENGDQYLPTCIPELPEYVAPHSEVVLPSIIRLANCLGVAGCFRFHGS